MIWKIETFTESYFPLGNQTHPWGKYFSNSMGKLFSSNTSEPNGLLVHSLSPCLQTSSITSSYYCKPRRRRDYKEEKITLIFNEKLIVKHFLLDSNLWYKFLYLFLSIQFSINLSQFLSVSSFLSLQKSLSFCFSLSLTKR